MKSASKRLESLDVLRGFDLFCLILLCPFLHAFYNTGDYPWMEGLMKQLDHVAWEGFAFWDLVMPLFMFMAGVSIPFALDKYQKTPDRRKVYGRIFKRFLVLWVLGMICQGNLLALDLASLRIFSNTLQAIAVGYAVSALLFLHTSWKIQVLISVFLLLVYWAGMTFVVVEGFGGGDYSAAGNFAEWMDREMLGHWRDWAEVDERGNVFFPAWYNYTWIWSSLNFIVTVMTGMFAGQILKGSLPEKNKLAWLGCIGVMLVVGGWLWHLQMPVIKRIWTSSMVLVSSGYSFLLMGVFYYIIDYKGFRRGWTWLKVIGMNSILAYLLSVEVGIIHFTCISRSLFFGFEQYMNEHFFRLLLVCSDMALVYLLLYILYKHKVFIKA